MHLCRIGCLIVVNGFRRTRRLIMRFLKVLERFVLRMLLMCAAKTREVSYFAIFIGCLRFALVCNFVTSQTNKTYVFLFYCVLYVFNICYLHAVHCVSKQLSIQSYVSMNAYHGVLDVFDNFIWDNWYLNAPIRCICLSHSPKTLNIIFHIVLKFLDVSYIADELSTLIRLYWQAFTVFWGWPNL